MFLHSHLCYGLIQKLMQKVTQFLLAHKINVYILQQQYQLKLFSAADVAHKKETCMNDIVNANIKTSSNFT